MHVLRMIYIYTWSQPKMVSQVLHNFSQQKHGFNSRVLGLESGSSGSVGSVGSLHPEGFRQGRIWQPQKRLPVVILKRNTSKSGDASRKLWRSSSSFVWGYQVQNQYLDGTPVLGARIRHGRSQSWELWAMCIQNVHHLQDSIERFQWLIPIIKLKIKQWTKDLRKHVFFCETSGLTNWTGQWSPRTWLSHPLLFHFGSLRCLWGWLGNWDVSSQNSLQTE